MDGWIKRRRRKFCIRRGFYGVLKMRRSFIQCYHTFDDDDDDNEDEDDTDDDALEIEEEPNPVVVEEEQGRGAISSC